MQALAVIALLFEAQLSPQPTLDTPEPDLCSSDSWVRAATARVQLGAFHPEYLPEVFVVPARQIDTASSLLSSREAVVLSIDQVRALTAVDVPPRSTASERMYLIRALATSSTRNGFAVYDSGYGRALVELIVDRSAPVEVVRQPLVVSFRGPLREVYQRCISRRIR